MSRTCFSRMVFTFVSILALALTFGCGTSSQDALPGSVPTAPTAVGSDSCVNNCHAASDDAAGYLIYASWTNTAHTINFRVQCENCHGNGSDHWGLGPIPYPHPTPAQSCYQCHSSIQTEGFDNTLHNNPNSLPGPLFFQTDASGTTQATMRGVPETTPSGTVVRNSQHIQECSVCHNPGQKFVFDRNRNLTEPDPNNMPVPQVSCMGCHEVHQLAQRVTIAQRTNPVTYPLYRQYLVDATGAQVAPLYYNTSGISWPTGGTAVTARIYQPNGSVQPNGTVDNTKVVGKNNELSTQALCAACHTVGKYLYAQTATHQTDVYSQYKNSAHANFNDAPFAEFTANPSAYTDATGKPYPNNGGHMTSYPYDMALTTTAATASTTNNAGNNNFQCFKCHNGIASRAWQDNVQGTSAAPVVFGDSTVTCLTCHDTHSDVSGDTFLVRKPVIMTVYPPTGTTGTPAISFSGNVFLDNTAVPLAQTGNATICVFCHQGRESGLTLYATKLAPGKTITGSFFNPHYLGTGAMLWGHNGYEFTGQSYSVNAAHQQANCPTCHMDNATVDNLNGGHSWSPNYATCNAAGCHGSSGLTPAMGKRGNASPAVDVYRLASDTTCYTGDANCKTQSIADAIRALQQKVLTQLQKSGICYDDLTYPYYFQCGTANAFTAWTPSTYKAAFNIAFAVKGLPSGLTSQANVPNSSAAVHNYQYIIQLLLDSLQNLGAYPSGAVRPAGTRPAVVYGPNQ